MWDADRDRGYGIVFEMGMQIEREEWKFRNGAYYILYQLW